MRIRFHQTCPSASADHPFAAGQIISVDELSPEMRAALASGQAEVLPDPELAMQGPPPERAQQRTGRSKGSR